MDYSQKSLEEIIQEFKKWPDDQFFPFLRHELLHYVTLIRQSAAMLDVINDTEDQQPFTKEDVHDFLDLILKSSDGLANLVVAAADYDKMKRDDRST